MKLYLKKSGSRKPVQTAITVERKTIDDPFGPRIDYSEKYILSAEIVAEFYSKPEFIDLATIHAIKSISNMLFAEFLLDLKDLEFSLYEGDMKKSLDLISEIRMGMKRYLEE